MVEQKNENCGMHEAEVQSDNSHIQLGCLHHSALINEYQGRRFVTHRISNAKLVSQLPWITRVIFIACTPYHLAENLESRSVQTAGIVVNKFQKQLVYIYYVALKSYVATI